MDWIDKTSYRWDRKGVDEPTTWEIRFESVVIIVHRYLGCEGWFMTCRYLGLECFKIYCDTPDDLEEAKERAVMEVRAKLFDKEKEVKKALFAIQVMEDSRGDK